jgi:hypothetical protein
MGCSYSIFEKPYVICRSRTPQRALGKCQLDHPKQLRKKMNNSRMTYHPIPSLNLSDASFRANPRN